MQIQYNFDGILPAEQYNPLYFYLEVNSTVFNGIYSQVTIYRIAAYFFFKYWLLKRQFSL